MSCSRRIHIPGAAVFFTVCLATRGSTLLVDEVVRLRAAVRATMAERPFRALAWVVLPDHMHCVWQLPKGDSDHSVRWGAIKARFSRDMRGAGFSPPPCLPEVRSGRYAGVNPGLRHDKGEVGIWQRWFWEHHLRSERDVQGAIRYCWDNPVKHGLVETPEAWRYSSVHRDARFGRFAA